MGSPEDRRPPKRMRVGGFEEEAAAYVKEEDMYALDCGVCFLPLKQPIFQCQVGHAVCEHCRDSFVVAVPGGGSSSSIKCHVCGVAGGYHRCHVMERVVESVRVPCVNAAHGCAAQPAYHDQHGHSQTCPHAPCHCPGEACGFVGSTAPWTTSPESIDGPSMAGRGDIPLFSSVTASTSSVWRLPMPTAPNTCFC
ncbi:hypothetical protein PR202_gb24853 [Eleusine coracana subsp. coracana]|uniref:RING-type E3 ubiquitin transferase n=1 Tax=Eleusine coracana subsp. coracana TaxID=191504 RepID=A0AAV5FJT5_ELECO|nr:hypothetical protein QOZ80_5BG0452740 [Eleusine coracana subsp. coracana]GJN36028.1 hypothetical protein PR202_gb24853 [Eleusine coracana subsp. coracana]